MYGFKIECTEGVGDVIKNVDQMFRTAREWVNKGDFAEVYQTDITRALWNELVTKCDEMEASWHRCVKAVFFMSAQSGVIELSKDSASSLLFHEPKTGITGGIIFHANVVNGTRTPIGTWSMHT